MGHENATIATYFSYAHPETVDTDLAVLVRFIADDRLIPHLGVSASWTTINDALETFATGRVDGKAVLTVT